MYHLFVYIPEEQSESLKEALFKIGIGESGNYSHHVWQTKGLGQFKPLNNSKPYSGISNEVKEVRELKLEFFCNPSVDMKKVISTLKLNHPYECPAYGIIKLEEY
jgi:hypothetical protein